MRTGQRMDRTADGNHPGGNELCNSRGVRRLRSGRAPPGCTSATLDAAAHALPRPRRLAQTADPGASRRQRPGVRSSAGKEPTVRFRKTGLLPSQQGRPRPSSAPSRSFQGQGLRGARRAGAQQVREAVRGASPSCNSTALFRGVLTTGSHGATSRICVFASGTALQERTRVGRLLL